LAAATGGTYLELAATDDLGPTFRPISQEIHSQYLLAFHPQVTTLSINWKFVFGGLV
jgi:hypothetical protein